MKIYRKEDFKIIGDKIKPANNFFSRSIGLLTKTSLNAGEGILFCPCNSIHSIGMKFIFDAIFIDKNKKIVHLMPSIKPFKLSPVIFNAKYVLEVKNGTTETLNLKIGDELVFED